MKKIQIVKFILGLVVAFMVLGCDSKPSLDFSSEENFDKANAEMVVNATDHEIFSYFLATVILMKNREISEDVMDDKNKKFDGMTLEEFVDYAKEKYPNELNDDIIAEAKIGTRYEYMVKEVREKAQKELED